MEKVNVWQTGVVDWFDKRSGKGFIKSLDGEFYPVHYSAIHSKSKKKNLIKNSPVKFKLYENTGHFIIDVVKEIPN